MKITSSQQMQHFGERFAQKIKSGGIIALYGNLGSGKTTFVQGLAKGLGIDKRIISPTFMIIRTYELSKQKLFYHIDLYRTNGADEEVREIMSNTSNIIAIEWAERITELPSKRYDIKFTYITSTIRDVEITEI